MSAARALAVAMAPLLILCVLGGQEKIVGIPDQDGLDAGGGVSGVSKQRGATPYHKVQRKREQQAIVHADGRVEMRGMGQSSLLSLGGEEIFSASAGGAGEGLEKIVELRKQEKVLQKKIRKAEKKAAEYQMKVEEHSKTLAQVQDYISAYQEKSRKALEELKGDVCCGFGFSFGAFRCTTPASECKGAFASPLDPAECLNKTAPSCASTAVCCRWDTKDNSRVKCKAKWPQCEEFQPVYNCSEAWADVECADDVKKGRLCWSTDEILKLVEDGNYSGCLPCEDLGKDKCSGRCTWKATKGKKKKPSCREKKRRTVTMMIDRWAG